MTALRRRQAAGRRYHRLLIPVIAVLALMGCADDSQTPEQAPVVDEFQSDIDGAVSTAENYWTDFFAAQGGQFVPVNEVISYTEPDEGDCGGQPFTLNNAFFCPSGEFIAYDETFLRREYQRIGDAFAFFLIGHEYAHAVQNDLNITHRLTIEHELQADCMAGAYLGDSVRSNDLQLESGDLDELLASLESVGDQPGIPWFAEGAHGTGEQRTAAFRQGSAGNGGGSSISTCF